MSGAELARRIEAEQRTWARRRGITVDADGRTREADDHLLVPLSSDTRAELTASAHRWLGEPGKPAPLCRLDASAALACAVFEPYRTGDRGALADALGLPSVDAVRFARPVAAEEGRRPVEADVWLDGPVPAAVFAHFADDYREPDPRIDPAAAADRALFAGLPGCAHFARDLQCGPGRFALAPAGRMVERAAALTRAFGGRGFRMIHLWWSAPGRVARLQAVELDRVRMRIAGEIDFVPLAWQTLHERLAGAKAPEVAERYFSA